MAVQYISEENFLRAKTDALWDARPGEPIVSDDVSTETNPEVVAYVTRQCTEDDSLWDDLENASSADFSPSFPPVAALRIDLTP